MFLCLANSETQSRSLESVYGNLPACSIVNLLRQCWLVHRQYLKKNRVSSLLSFPFQKRLAPPQGANRELTFYLSRYNIGSGTRLTQLVQSRMYVYSRTAEFRVSFGRCHVEFPDMWRIIRRQERKQPSVILLMDVDGETESNMVKHYNESGRKIQRQDSDLKYSIYSKIKCKLKKTCFYWILNFSLCIFKLLS